VRQKGVSADTHGRRGGSATTRWLKNGSGGRSSQRVNRKGQEIGRRRFEARLVVPCPLKLRAPRGQGRVAAMLARRNLTCPFATWVASTRRARRPMRETGSEGCDDGRCCAARRQPNQGQRKSQVMRSRRCCLRGRNGTYGAGLPRRDPVLLEPMRCVETSVFRACL